MINSYDLAVAGNYKDYNREKLVIILPQEGWFCGTLPAGWARRCVGKQEEQVRKKE